MKLSNLAVLGLCCALYHAVSAQNLVRGPRQQPTVVVELFTSEGCSDCPPADDLLNAIARQSSSGAMNVIPLAFHVTYWDQYGWHDRFDNDRFTQRQRDYQMRFHLDSVYTPQTVIDGRYQTVGNNRTKVLDYVQTAAADPKPVTVELALTGNSLSIRAHALGTASGRVLLAITQDGLSTEVSAGENKSKTLNHDAVVRSLEDLGKVRDGEFSKTASLKLQNGWARDKLHVVVLVQDNEGHVIGAASAPLT